MMEQRSEILKEMRKASIKPEKIFEVIRLSQVFFSFCAFYEDSFSNFNRKKTDTDRDLTFIQLSLRIVASSISYSLIKLKLIGLSILGAVYCRPCT